MFEVMVHPHALKHGISESDILHAWENFIAKQRRTAPREDEIVAISATANGMMIQLVAKDLGDVLLIFHTMAPPSEKVMRELGLKRRRAR